MKKLHDQARYVGMEPVDRKKLLPPPAPWGAPGATQERPGAAGPEGSGSGLPGPARGCRPPVLSGPLPGGAGPQPAPPTAPARGALPAGLPAPAFGACSTPWQCPSRLPSEPHWTGPAGRPGCGWVRFLLPWFLLEEPLLSGLPSEIRIAQPEGGLSTPSAELEENSASRSWSLWTLGSVGRIGPAGALVNPQGCRPVCPVLGPALQGPAMRPAGQGRGLPGPARWLRLRVCPALQGKFANPLRNFVLFRTKLGSPVHAKGPAGLLACRALALCLLAGRGPGVPYPVAGPPGTCDPTGSPAPFCGEAAVDVEAEEAVDHFVTCRGRFATRGNSRLKVLASS